MKVTGSDVYKRQVTGQYEVNVDSSRTIKEILVKVGDEVEEGQTLVTYDTSELEMQVKMCIRDRLWMMWWMASAMLAKTLLTVWKTAWMTRQETIITVTQRRTVQDNG